jgi:hypothetical protein
MLGIGVAELLVLVIVGLFLVGVPIAIVSVLLVVLLRTQESEGNSQLRKENNRLREEIAELKRTSV